MYFWLLYSLPRSIANYAIITIQWLTTPIMQFCANAVRCAGGPFSRVFICFRRSFPGFFYSHLRFGGKGYNMRNFYFTSFYKVYFFIFVFLFFISYYILFVITLLLRLYVLNGPNVHSCAYVGRYTVGALGAPG